MLLCCIVLRLLFCFSPPCATSLPSTSTSPPTKPTPTSTPDVKSEPKHHTLLRKVSSHSLFTVEQKMVATVRKLAFFLLTNFLYFVWFQRVRSLQGTSSGNNHFHWIQDFYTKNYIIIFRNVSFSKLQINARNVCCFESPKQT